MVAADGLVVLAYFKSECVGHILFSLSLSNRIFLPQTKQTDERKYPRTFSFLPFLRIPEDKYFYRSVFIDLEIDAFNIYTDIFLYTREQISYLELFGDINHLEISTKDLKKSGNEDKH